LPVPEGPARPVQRDPSSAEVAVAPPQAGPGNGAQRPDEDDARPPNTPRRTLRNAPRKTQQGLPEGWVIDEDGFVVPGPR
jgi:hypothetical protein